MLAILAPAILFLTTPALAEVSCPAETRAIHRCRSTPKAGDEEMASRLFRGMLVCRGEDKNYLVGDTGAPQSEALPATAEDRPGGSTYVWKAEREGVELRFDIATGLAPGTEAPARLKVIFHQAGDLKSSSSYTCP